MKTRIFNHIITTGTAMRIYSALEHTRYEYGCTVPGGYLEDPDPLRGGFLTVAVIFSNPGSHMHPAPSRGLGHTARKRLAAELAVATKHPPHAPV